MPNERREIETQILLLETPFGDGPHLRESEKAAAWLLAHAERVYPLLLDRLRKGSAGPAVIELTPRFGREESIAPLERLLNGPEAIAWAAGQALALHPQPAAGEALRRGLASQEMAVAVVAADALGTRGDPNDCAALAAAAASPDPALRHHALEAARRLACPAPGAAAES